MKFLFLLVVTALPFCSFGQTGVLTVFSEDGDKFYLILNGIKQNTTSQTNVRVDGLISDFYNCKIIFDNSSIPEITKNISVKDMGTQTFAEATYRIKKTKDGELKLKFFGFTPVPPTYNAPPDVMVVHYGQTAQPSSNTVSQTTVTTTNNTNPNGLNMNVGANGLNMNMNISDPNNGNGNVNISMNLNDATMNGQTTTTTTTSSKYSSSSTDNSNYNNNINQPANSGCQYPMDFSSFNAAKETIKKSAFEDTKLSTAKTILSSNCVSTDQVITICNLFSFENSKLDFAKYAYSKTTDKGNYFKVANVFSFDSNKTDLNNFISNGGR